MAQNDIYLVRESSDGTFEEIANSPFRYDAANATDQPDKANNTFHINTKLRVDELEVNGDTTVIHTDSNTTEQLSVTNDGTGPAAVINQIGAEPLIDIQDDGVSAFYIEDGGNVGIGTSNPERLLHIESADASAIVLTDTTASTAKNRALINNDDSLSFGLYNDGFTSFSKHLSIDPIGNIEARITNGGNWNYTFGAYDGNGLIIGKAGGDTSSLGDRGHEFYINFGSDDNLYRIRNAAGDVVNQIHTSGDTFFKGGNVGIGTDSPTAPLTIVEKDNVALKMLKSSGQTLFTIGEDGNNNVVLDSSTVDLSGNVVSSDLVIKGGFLGIGATNPAAHLHVVGQAYFTRDNDSSAPLYCEQTGDGPSAYFVGGGVGIGTTTPNHDLTLEGAANLSTIGTNNSGLRLHPDTGRSIQFYTNDTSRVYIHSDGNVGIGTDSPEFPLHIKNTLTNGTVMLENENDDSNAAPDLILRRSSPSPADNDNLGHIKWQGKKIGNDGVHSTVDYADIYGRIEVAGEAGSGTFGGAGKLLFRTRTGLGSGSHNTMCFDHAGRLGIGALSPNHTLEARSPQEGETASFLLAEGEGDTGGIAISTNTASTYRVNITHDDTGLIFSNNATVSRPYAFLNANVGIGTTNPDHPLTVASGGNMGGVRLVGSPNNDNHIRYDYPSMTRAGALGSITAVDDVDHWVAGADAHAAQENDFIVWNSNRNNIDLLIAHDTGNVGIGSRSMYPSANLEVSNSGGAASNMIWAKADGLPGDSGFEGAWTTYGVKVYDEAAGQPDYSWSVGMDSSETGVPKFKIGYSFHDANKPGENSLFTIESNGDIHFTGDLYQNGTLFTGGGGGGGATGGDATRNPDGSWSGGASFGGGTPSTLYPNALDVGGDSSSGTNFTISNTYNDGTPQGTGNTYRFCNDPNGGTLKIGPDGGAGTSVNDTAMLWLMPSSSHGGVTSGAVARSKLSVRNSYLEVLGDTENAPGGSGYNQDGTELKLLTSIGHKSTYYGVVDFDYKDLNADDTLPIYWFHLVFRRSGAGTMNGFKYKAEIGSSRLSTANNSTHWLNTGFATDESFAYIEEDLDFYNNNQHMGTVESVGKIEIISRQVYPTRDDSGDLWGMKALPGDSDLTLDDQTNYIVRYGIRFSDNTLHGVTTPNAEKEGRLHIQLEFMQAGAYGAGVIAPHFINVP